MPSRGGEQNFLPRKIKKCKLFQKFSLSASERHSSVSRANPTYNKPFVNPINNVMETQYHISAAKTFSLGTRQSIFGSVFLRKVCLKRWGKSELESQSWTKRKDEPMNIALASLKLLLEKNKTDLTRSLVWDTGQELASTRPELQRLDRGDTENRAGRLMCSTWGDTWSVDSRHG